MAHVMITAFGKTQTVRAWHEEADIPISTINYRLKTGMPPEVALAADGTIRNEWRHPRRSEDKRRARRIFSRTRSIKTTARRMGKSPSTIHRYLCEEGISVAKILQRRKKRAWKMCYIDSMSFVDIGKKLSVHPSTAAGYVREVEGNPSLQCVDIPGLCDCGTDAAICVKITVRQGAKEILELCSDCYEMLLEIEGKLL